MSAVQPTDGPWVVELLARNGDVVLRERVRALPIRIGRGYDNDVILDDDYAAPAHAVAEPGADGRLVLRDLGTRNGIALRGRRVREAILEGDTVVRIGHTWLRVRPAGFAVAPELPDRTFHRWEGAPPGGAGILIIVLASLLARWLGDTQYFEYGRYGVALAGGVGIALLWSGAWAFANRLFGRHARLGRHLFVFACGVAGVFAWALLAATLGYAWSAEGFTRYGSHAATLIVAATVYFHLCTIRPQHRVRYRWACAGLAVLGSGLLLIGNIQRTGRFADELYMAVLMPPAVRASPDHGIDEFMRDVEAMRPGLDRGRGRKPGEDEIED
jgi:hypothetical protein